MPPARLHRLLGACTATGLLLLTAGCGILPGSDRPEREQPAQSQAGETPVATPDPDLPPGVPTDLGEPIATLPYDDEHGTTLSLDVYPMRSHGADVVQMWAKITKKSDPPEDTTISNIVTTGWEVTDTGISKPDGFQLLDTRNRQLHRPMRLKASSVCGPGTGNLKFKAKEAYVSCLFSRPESDTITLLAQNFGDVPGVDVSTRIKPAPSEQPSAGPTNADVLAPKEPLRPGEPQIRDLVESSIDLGGVASVDQGADTVDMTVNANVAFDKDRAELKPAATGRLTDLIGELKKQPPGAVTIKGYTDNLGSHEHGIDLSNRRAQAVQSALEPGLPGYQFTAEGLAEADPVAPNDSEENRARNRRVEISYRAPAEAKPTPEPTPPAPTTAPVPQPTNEVAGAVVASDRNGGRYELGVHPVVVEDGLASMRVTVRVENDPNPQEPQLDFLSADDSDGADRVMGTPDGVALIDTTRKVEWRPATDREYNRNACFAQPDSNLGTLDTRKVDMTCWYGVPASDKVDVKIGSAGTVKDVPVVRR